jgi:hypothetical protein
MFKPLSAASTRLNPKAQHLRDAPDTHASAHPGAASASRSAGPKAPDGAGARKADGRPQAPNAGPATDAAAPYLPDPAGQQASPAALARTLAASESFLEGGDGFFAVLQTFTQAHQQTAQMALRFKTLRALAQMQAKSGELNAEQNKIAGERQSIVWRTFVSGLSTAASFATGAIGSQIEWQATQGVSRSNTGWNVALGSALKNSSGAIGQMVSVGGEALDRVGWLRGGGRYAADEAGMAQRQHGMQGQLAQNDVESANNLLEHAREQRKNALSAMMATLQMWAEAYNQRASALS